LIQPVAIDDLEPEATGEDRERMLHVIISAGENAVPGGSVLIAIARRDGLSVTPGRRPVGPVRPGITGDTSTGWGL